MVVRQASEVAARLARLHDEQFKGSKKNKPLWISENDFYRVADLKQLKASKYREIASKLLKDHALVLGRAEDFFILVSADACEHWIQIRTSVVSRELKRKAPVAAPLPAASTPQTALSPAAAWPFPTGIKP